MPFTIKKRGKQLYLRGLNKNLRQVKTLASIFHHIIPYASDYILNALSF